MHNFEEINVADRSKHKLKRFVLACWNKQKITKIWGFEIYSKKPFNAALQ